MASNVETNTGLKEALIETLNNTLSPESDIRHQAEEQIQVLEVTEEFGVYLVELSLDRSGNLAVRQLASILLKQYVEAHWCQDSAKFRVPECPAYSKERIRELLPHGLYDPSKKVRSSVAYAISCIGNWDWPEHWPQLFDLIIAAVQSGDEAGVHGAMRVLTEFSRDLDDVHIPRVAPVILPEMYNIFCQDQKYSIRTRSHAVEIFSSVAGVICMLGEYNKTLAKTLLYPSLPPFTQAMLKALQSHGDTVDSGLKKEILKALTALVSNAPRQMTEYLPDVLLYVWQTLSSSAITYLNTTVNAREEANDPTDSDGEVLGFESLVFSLFEFVSSLLRASKHREMIRRGVPDLLYFLLLYMQMTEEQMQKFYENPDAFVEFEDEETFAYSVRISAQDLLSNLRSDLPAEFGVGLVSAVDRHIQKADQDRLAGDPSWWKGYEVVLVAVGLSGDFLVSQVAANKLTFDLHNFVEVVLKKNLDPSLPPFLVGKAVWCGARLGRALDTPTLQSLLQASCASLQPSCSPIIRVTAIRAIGGFCELFDNSSSGNKSGGAAAAGHSGGHSLDTLKPFLPALVEGLVVVTTQASSEVMALALETLCLVMGLNHDLTTPYVGRVSSLCLAVFIKASNDPVLVSLVQDLLQELCGYPTCTAALQAKFFPTLTSLLNAAPDKVPDGIHSVSLDMMTVLVRSCHKPDSESLMMSTAFPAVVNRTLHTEDLSTQQNGGECLRAYLAVAAPQIIAWRDSEGRSGLDYVVQVCTQLLAPGGNDSSAAFVGRLVTALIRHASQHLGDSLHMLLRGVISKLQSTETLLVVQNLIVVFGQLIHTELEDVLSFLSSVPGPSGDSALVFVLTSWCGRQHNFYGSYERKVTVLALAKLLEHGVINEDARLQAITVQGDQVISNERGVRTRSQTAVRPEQWTRVPLLVKLFKLIVCELSSAMDANMAGGKDDLEDGDEDEGWEDEGDEEDDGGGDDDCLYTSDLLDCTAGDGDGGDCVGADDDPDAAADPLNAVDLQVYLTNFIITFSQHPAYHMFIPHLNPHEREVLTSIRVPVS